MPVTERQRGAAAVEFALVVPLLLSLLLGIVEFGYFLFLSASAAGAAREGARAMAITQDQAKAVSTAADSFNATTGQTASSVVAPPDCPSGSSAVVSVSYSYPTLTGFFGTQFTASGRGEMRCGG